MSTQAPFPKVKNFKVVTGERCAKCGPTFGMSPPPPRPARDHSPHLRERAMEKRSPWSGLFASNDSLAFQVCILYSYKLQY